MAAMYRKNFSQSEAYIMEALETVSEKEMEAKYETEKKELEIAQQKHVITRQNIKRWLLTGGVAVCAVFLVLLLYMLRLRSRHNTALTERNNTLSEMNTSKEKRKPDVSPIPPKHASSHPNCNLPCRKCAT
jgi:cytidylate kinase